MFEKKNVVRAISRAISRAELKNGLYRHNTELKKDFDLPNIVAIAIRPTRTHKYIIITFI
jgi:hypothetical protein